MTWWNVAKCHGAYIRTCLPTQEIPKGEEREYRRRQPQKEIPLSAGADAQAGEEGESNREEHTILVRAGLCSDAIDDIRLAGENGELLLDCFPAMREPRIEVHGHEPDKKSEPAAHCDGRQELAQRTERPTCRERSRRSLPRLARSLDRAVYVPLSSCQRHLSTAATLVNIVRRRSS